MYGQRHWASYIVDPIVQLHPDAYGGFEGEQSGPETGWGEGDPLEGQAGQPAGNYGSGLYGTILLRTGEGRGD